MFAHDPHDLKPCRHMTGLVSALADDTLTGIARWFTTQHIAGCPRCANGLEYFHALRARLAILEGREDAKKKMTPEQWGAAEAEWEKADRKKAATAD